MTRAINPLTLAALEASSAAPVYFVELQVTGTPDRFHSWLGTISWGGNDWIGVGDIYNLETLSETNKLRPQPLRMGLSGLSSTITDIVYNANWYERPCIVYLGAMTGDGTLVADPDVWFSGVLQDLQMQMGSPDGDIVSVTAESELIFFKRSRNVRYTNNQLQSEFPGDLGLEFLESVATQKVVWRGRNNTLGDQGDRSSMPSTDQHDSR